MAKPRSDIDMWHVLQAFVGNPIRIAELIEQRGFTSYCPVREVTWTHPFHRELSKVYKRPLFPGYLFVLTREGGFHWSMIEDSNTRARFLCVDNRCLVLDEREMEHVRTIEAWENTPEPPAPPPRLAEAGDTVKILHSAFYGEFAQVVRVKGQRAEIRLKSGLEAFMTSVRLDQIETIDCQPGQVAAGSN